MVDFFNNQILMVSVIAWALAQLIKVIIVLVQRKPLTWGQLLSSGGMPSSHTSTVVSLATSIAMREGMGSVFFAIAAVLAIIVMYDAAGVRQSVGQHSAVLNRIIKDIRFKASRPEMEKDLREFIGHTPLQVLMGALLGILVAIFFNGIIWGY